jgi:hypothetical protein
MLAVIKNNKGSNTNRLRINLNLVGFSKIERLASEEIFF